VLEVRVHDARPGGPAGVAGARRRRLRRSAFAIHLDADLLRLLVQRIDRVPKERDVVGGEDLPEILELLLDGLPRGFRDPRGVLLQELLRGVHELVARVPELDDLSAPPVVLRVRFRVADRLVDLSLVHPLRGDNVSLGRFYLTGMPPAPRGVPKIEVTFDIDANGILNVSAKDLATGKDQKITITSSSGLSKEEVSRMAKEAEAHAAEDQERREQIEAKNQLDSLVYNV